MTERFLKISAAYIKHTLWTHLFISVVLCLAAPLFIGTKNLDSYQVAKVLEGYVAFVGIILLIPVFIPDMNRDIRDLTASKKMSMSSLHVIRIVWAVVFLVGMSLLCLCVLQRGSCTFDFGQMFYTVMANELFLGGMGTLVFALSDQIVFAYMVPLVYYVSNLGGRAKFGNFWIFSMQAGQFTQKHYLMIGGIVFIVGAVLGRRMVK